MDEQGDEVLQVDEESDTADEFADASDDNINGPGDARPMQELFSEDADNEDSDDSTGQFDISLSATHSYLSRGLVAIKGRTVLEPGWRGSVPCVGHHSVLYPGETVPMVMTHPRDCEALHAAIQGDRLFGLVFAEVSETGNYASGYGVLCEVFEATAPERAPTLTFKARARQRFKFLKMPRRQPIVEFNRVKNVDVVVLPEVTMGNPFQNSRLLSLDTMRSTASKEKIAKIRQMDAVVTNWPPFVFNGCDLERISKVIHRYFNQLKYESLPNDTVSLSFWAASNLPLSYKDRLDLFKEDNALQRLRMEVKFVEEYYVLCCQSCGDPLKTLIARREDIFAMSSEGMKSNYCNLGGYVHDIMTVSQIFNVRTSGLPSSEFSWFPGYMWTILVCEYCNSHIGWKFTSSKRAYRLQTFYAICRNYVFPSAPDQANEL